MNDYTIYYTTLQYLYEWMFKKQKKTEKRSSLDSICI